MGRLQKKKPASAKKKKKLKASAAGSGATAAGDRSSAAGLTVVPGKDAKKKPAPTVRKGQPPARTAAGSQKKNIVQKSIQFLREVKIELKKVVWPSRKQALGTTAVVLILVLIISTFLGVIDFGLTSIIQAVLN
jgi:preprotein translocase subunit SecE